MLRKILFIVFIMGYTGCKTADPKSKPDDAELVHVATIEFTNLSNETSQDYLGASISEATTQSMGKIFRYYHVSDAKTMEIAGEFKRTTGKLKPSDLRSHGLAMDADLLIYGTFNVIKGKKGDQVEISMSVFRTDKSQIIATLIQQTQVSNRLFDEIDKMSAGLVAKIADYRMQLLRDSGRTDNTSAKDGKIELTRESINIAPFIPPIF